MNKDAIKRGSRVQILNGTHDGWFLKWESPTHALVLCDDGVERSVSKRRIQQWLERREPMKARLIQLSSSNNNLRTKEVEGEIALLPRTGCSFLMIAPPLDPTADFRFIETSEVKRVERIRPGEWEFDTQNSKYLLKEIR